MTDFLEMLDHTEDGKPIPICIDLDIDEETTHSCPAIAFIEKIMYGNLNLTYEFIRNNDPDSAEQIERELQTYVDKTYNK